jgi:guanylate kinase
MGFEINYVFIEDDVFNLHISRKRLVEPAKAKGLKKYTKKGNDRYFLSTQ